MEKTNFSFEKVAVTKIKPWDKNPRTISDSALKGLKASLQRYGMPQPIIVNRETMRIVGGHMRHRAALELGWKEVPVVYVSLSANEEKALNITLNNRNITGSFTDGLQDILSEIRSELELPEFEGLRLPEMELNQAWDLGVENVVKEPEHTDGIMSTIKVLCPQELTEKVKAFIRDQLANAQDLPGVAVV